MQDPRRSEAAWQKGCQLSGCVLAEVCWHIYAKPFSFPATLLGGSNKQIQLFAFLATSQWYADLHGNTEGTYTHLRTETVILFFWTLLKESFLEKRLLSLKKTSLLWGAGWPLAIPWPHLWLILSVQQLEPPSARGNSFTPGQENCKHIYSLNMNNLHVLCSLTI